MMPALPAILRRPALSALFGIFLAWSVFVQVIGAFVYDVNGWNNRVAVVNTETLMPTRYIDYDPPGFTHEEVEKGSEIVGLNIDQPIYRHRFWSLTDNQIGFYIRHWKDARQTRSTLAEQSSSKQSIARQISSLESVRESLIEAGYPEDARRFAKIISDLQEGSPPK